MTKKIEENEAKAVSTSRPRKERKKVYERPKETAIPQALKNHFLKDDYELRLVRWSIGGEEDYRNLYRKDNEGYELVSASEIPAELLQGLQVMNTKAHAGLICIGDLCLAKVDKDLRKSKRKALKAVTDREVDAVDINVLEKKGFRNLGTKSRVMLREPSFES